MTDHEAPDDDDLTEQEAEPTLDDILEAARIGEIVVRPEHVGPVIGSQQIVKEDVPTKHMRQRCKRCFYFVTDPHDGHVPVPMSDAEWHEVGQEMADNLAAMMHATRFDKFLEWGPDEWRTIPDFGNYEMNGYTREVRRPARVAIMKNGRPRSYPEKEIRARDSSVTLSNEHGAKTRGIEKLWKATFPEYAPDPNSWQVHKMRKEWIPGELGRVVEKP